MIKKIGSSKKNQMILLSTLLIQNIRLSKFSKVANIYFDGNTENDSVRVELVSNVTPHYYPIKLSIHFLNDIEAYTIRFEFYKDTLY
jgi:ABC-type cobalt transport system substrate-binding protein